MQTIQKTAFVQICYPVANGLLWCNAIYRKGVLRENPSGKGYKFPCPWARLKKPIKKGESKITTPLKEVVILQTEKI